MQFHDEVHVGGLESSKKNKICEKTKREIESNKINSNLVSGKWLVRMEKVVKKSALSEL